MRTFLAKSGWREARVVKVLFVRFSFALKEFVCLQENLNQVNAADTETGSAGERLVLLLF